MTKYKRVKGFNDVYNTDYKIKKYITSVIKEVSETYNYKTIQLPVLEYASLYTDYYKEDIKDSLFTISNKYNIPVALRYNNLLSMARSIIENKLYVDGTMPIKMMSHLTRYTFNKMDKSLPATSQEYIFMNANSSNYLLDVENINLVLDILYHFGMENVLLNIHRNDLELKTFNLIKKQLNSLNIKYEVIDNYINDYDKLSYEFYYDGLCLAYGGRHDNLFSNLQAPDISSTSVILDLDEIQNIIEFSNLIPNMEEELDFIILSEDEDYSYCFYFASCLRECGARVDIMYSGNSIERKKDIVDRMDVAYTLIVNKEDAKKGLVIIRNSINKEEAKVKFDDFLNSILNAHDGPHS